VSADPRREVEVVVTDHAMPGLTGLEAAAQIRETRPDLPVVLASGYAELPAAIPAGIVRLPKPFTLAELAAAIADAAAGPA
jgi:CheY-like chemotaxis protein